MSASVEKAWTAEEISTAIQMRRNGRSYSEIGDAVDRTTRAVRSKIGSEGILSKRWTEKQFRHLEANAHKTDQELAEEISKLGPERSADAVKTKRRDLRANRQAPEPQAVELPWPILRGTDEQRDRRFVEAVIREALRLGLYRKAAA